MKKYYFNCLQKRIPASIRQAVVFSLLSIFLFSTQELLAKNVVVTEFDVIVDAYKRTSQKQYLNFYPLWWKGAPQYNFSGKEIDPWRN